MIPQIYGFHCEEAQGGAFHVTQSQSFQLDRRLKWQTPKPRKGRRQKIVWRRRRRRYWFALALMQMTAVAKAFFGRSLVVYSQLMPIIWYIMIYGYKVNAYPNLNQTQWESKHYESSAALSIGPPCKVWQRVLGLVTSPSLLLQCLWKMWVGRLLSFPENFCSDASMFE